MRPFLPVLAAPGQGFVMHLAHTRRQITSRHASSRVPKTHERAARCSLPTEAAKHKKERPYRSTACLQEAGHAVHAWPSHNTVQQQCAAPAAARSSTIHASCACHAAASSRISTSASTGGTNLQHYRHLPSLGGARTKRAMQLTGGCHQPSNQPETTHAQHRDCRMAWHGRNNVYGPRCDACTAETLSRRLHLGLRWPMPAAWLQILRSRSFSATGGVRRSRQDGQALCVRVASCVVCMGVAEATCGARPYWAVRVCVCAHACMCTHMNVRACVRA